MNSDASLAAAPLPDDLETCQRELQHTRATLAETALLFEELRSELELLKRYIYGRRSERVVDPPGQGRLFPDAAEAEESSEAGGDAEEEIAYRRCRRGQGWSKLHEHLPREEMHVGVPEAYVNGGQPLLPHFELHAPIESRLEYPSM